MSVTNDDALFAKNADPDRIEVGESSAPSTRKYLIFMIEDSDGSELKLGVDAESVVEILNSYSVTYLPMMPDYVCGIFNMRGQIIPVMDIRLRLGKVSEKRGLLIVLSYNEQPLGILVDAVDRIIDIDEHEISSVPSNESSRFVSGMCTIPDLTGTMLVLNCEQLFDHE